MRETCSCSTSDDARWMRRESESEFRLRFSNLLNCTACLLRCQIDSTSCVFCDDDRCQCLCAPISSPNKFVIGTGICRVQWRRWVTRRREARSKDDSLRRKTDTIASETLHLRKTWCHRTWCRWRILCRCRRPVRDFSSFVITFLQWRFPSVWCDISVHHSNWESKVMHWHFRKGPVCYVLKCHLNHMTSGGTAWAACRMVLDAVRCGAVFTMGQRISAMLATVVQSPHDVWGGRQRLPRSREQPRQAATTHTNQGPQHVQSQCRCWKYLLALIWSWSVRDLVMSPGSDYTKTCVYTCVTSSSSFCCVGFAGFRKSQYISSSAWSVSIRS